MQDDEVEHKVTSTWWLLPILFSWLGGIIAYFCVRDRDRRMAKRMLIVGIILTVIPLVVIVGLLALGMFDYSYDEGLMLNPSTALTIEEAREMTEVANVQCIADGSSATVSGTLTNLDASAHGFEYAVRLHDENQSIIIDAINEYDAGMIQPGETIDVEGLVIYGGPWDSCSILVSGIYQ